MQRSRKVSDQNSKGVEYLMKKNKVTVVKGAGVLQPRRKVKVGNDTYEAKKAVLIATGSRVKGLPQIGLEINKTTVISSDEALFLEKAPASMAIIGAGAVGMEFANIFHAFRHHGDLDRGTPADPTARGRRGIGRPREELQEAGIDVIAGAKVEEGHAGEGQGDPGGRGGRATQKIDLVERDLPEKSVSRLALSVRVRRRGRRKSQSPKLTPARLAAHSFLASAPTSARVVSIPARAQTAAFVPRSSAPRNGCACQISQPHPRRLLRPPISRPPDSMPLRGTLLLVPRCRALLGSNQSAPRVCPAPPGAPPSAVPQPRRTGYQNLHSFPLRLRLSKHSSPFERYAPARNGQAIELFQILPPGGDVNAFRSD